ncbi:CRISPR-associated protein Cas5 [Chamaesiphon sp. VAR_48_metabat_135_sub]|uniref:CRISPR-associated protein Cas5 n=1 Tax=Chamaesiphon sp. VAR_48_metabat_135_sub TaxID=2964699 RepID=UPI00286B3DB9|nr:CRISPR-associated protein Cas5 [Chamaesiphon sp. VAR_48_metabat_135_sub]
MQIYLECPCTSFPRSFARDFKETYLYPPPSTIYGMLLSLVGEVDLNAHVGVRIAIGIIGVDSPISRIIRKQRNHKYDNGGSEHKKRVAKYGEQVYPSQLLSKPNHQELLTDLKIAVQIDSSSETAMIKLAERIAIALSTPSQISRFGGLSLGESWALVNGVRAYRESDGDVRWLIKDNRGLIGLPVWIDRSTTQGTFARFSLGEFTKDCWVQISPPVSLTPAKPPKATRKKKSD